MIYDYIIVGAGLGGLSAGLNLTKHDKKVLILEKNSLPGGLASTIKKGRFEFDTSLTEIYDYGDQKNTGTIKNILDKYNLNIETSLIKTNSKIKVLDTNEEYEIKGGIEDFFVELEKMKKGSSASLKKFLSIIKEIHEALKKLEQDKLKIEDYPNFNKFLTMNTIDALTSIKMPKDTIHRLGYLWLYLGSPLNKLSFIDFAEFMYKLVTAKTAVLNQKSLDLTLKMVNKITENGGKVYYRSLVTKIEDKDDLKEVITSNGHIYLAKHVICNLSKRYVYKNLIKDEKEVRRLENARTLSPNGIVVYLGLNKNIEELGLTNYHYYQFQNINSVINTKNMNTFYHHTFEGIVPNVVNEFASPKNTSILILRTNYIGDVFSKTSYNNNEKLKEDLADNLIEQFEEAFNIDIKEFIEEIEVVTPYTISRYTNNVNGSMKGYMRLGYDNAIHRLISYQDELLPNISFVGASSLFGGGADNAIYSGYYITEKLLKEDK